MEHNYKIFFFFFKSMCDQAGKFTVTENHRDVMYAKKMGKTKIAF